MLRSLSSRVCQFPNRRHLLNLFPFRQIIPRASTVEFRPYNMDQLELMMLAKFRIKESDITYHVKRGIMTNHYPVKFASYCEIMDHFRLLTKSDINSILGIKIDQLVWNELSELLPYHKLSENRYYWDQLQMILFYAANYNSLKDDEYFQMFVGDTIYPNDQILYYIKRMMRRSNIVEILQVYHKYIDICNTLMNLPPSSATYKIPDMKILVPTLYQNNSYQYRELYNILFLTWNMERHNEFLKIFRQDIHYSKRVIMDNIRAVMKHTSDVEIFQVYDEYIQALLK